VTDIIASLRAVISADTSGFSRGLGEARNQLGQVSQQSNSMLGGLAKFGIAAGVAGALFVAGIGVASVAAASAHEQAVTRLNAVLKSTHGIAGVTADSALELAAALQKTTQYSDEDVLSAENLLLTFTNIGKDIFPEATSVILDMSTALGQDLKSSSVQLGKALQDPVEGVTALKRVGVNFSDAQRDMIKQMVASGNVMGAQKFILKELQTEFGGAAAAAGNTFAGKMAQAKNALDDAFETIGGVLLHGLTAAASAFANFLRGVGA